MNAEERAIRPSRADNGNSRARLLISCRDRPGIVAAVSSFLAESGANIVHSDQHSTEPREGLFFMRVVFDLPDLATRGERLRERFADVARTFSMEWRMTYASKRKRLAIFVSREEHCLLELLWQWSAGDLQADIVMVISNHTKLEPVARAWGIPFHCIPVDPSHRAVSEDEQMRVLSGNADLVALARYMQILSPAFCASWAMRIINIHHSFLPAFVGASPYDQAHQRGVKLIGATAHYVTTELDAGPIIEQDVARVDHRHTVTDLKRIGRSIERVVLARAVSWHVEDRVLVHGNKTVVFA